MPFPQVAWVSKSGMSIRYLCVPTSDPGSNALMNRSRNLVMSLPSSTPNGVAMSAGLHGSPSGTPPHRRVMSAMNAPRPCVKATMVFGSRRSSVSTMVRGSVPSPLGNTSGMLMYDHVTLSDRFCPSPSGSHSSSSTQASSLTNTPISVPMKIRQLPVSQVPDEHLRSGSPSGRGTSGSTASRPSSGLQSTPS